MDIINKIDKLLIGDQVATGGVTTTGNVEPNLSKGNVDVIGGECPKGQVYDKKKKVCVPVNEQGNGAGNGMGNGMNGNGMNGNGMNGNGMDTTNGNGMSKDADVVTRLHGFTYYTRSVKKKKCPEGMEYDEKLEVCVPKMKNRYGINKMKNEASVVGGSYVSGNTINIIGSGQTRVWGISTDPFDRGSNRSFMPDLARKEKLNVVGEPDKTKENILGRTGLRFDPETGAFTPSFWGEVIKGDDDE